MAGPRTTSQGQSRAAPSPTVSRHIPGLLANEHCGLLSPSSLCPRPALCMCDKAGRGLAAGRERSGYCFCPEIPAWLGWYPTVNTSNPRMGYTSHQFPGCQTSHQFLGCHGETGTPGDAGTGVATQAAGFLFPRTSCSGIARATFS